MAVKGNIRKVELDIDVLEAAKERCRYLFSRFDDIVCSFSGGKDSLVVLELLAMVQQEMGITKKIDVIFYDEELISTDHEEFCMKIAKDPRFNFRWICHPLVSERFVLGKKMKYVQWDLTREWIRPQPELAEKFHDAEAVHESDIFKKLLRKDYGNVCVVLGLRASESPARMNGILGATDIEMPFISEVGTGYAEAKPIFDWQTTDVFKFFYDHKLEYAPVYDKQVWGKAEFRVATPFNNAGSKVLDKLKGYDPQFYDRLITVFPEMIVQEKYYKTIDRTKVFENYGVNPEGILRWVDETLVGPDRTRCLQALGGVFKNRAIDKAQNSHWVRYPLYWVFYSCYIGAYKQYIAVVAEAYYTPEMKKYEDAYDEYKKQNPDYKYE